MVPHLMLNTATLETTLNASQTLFLMLLSTSLTNDEREPSLLCLGAGRLIEEETLSNRTLLASLSLLLSFAILEAPAY